MTAPAPATAPRATVRARRAWPALVLLGVGAAAAAVLVHLWLFPLYSLNRDDSVYVAFARMIEHGTFTLPADQDAFRPWASAVVDDRIVVKYTPPWSAVLALAGVLTGSEVVGLAACAGAAAVLVALLAGEVLGDRPAGLVAGALFAVSPIVLVQSGTYLSYLFELALLAAVGWLLLSGLRRHSTPRLVVAGTLAAVAAWARPFDALLVVLPFAVWALWTTWSTRDAAPDSADSTHVGTRGRRWWRWMLPVLAGALPVGALALGYHALVLGDPLRLPYTVTGTRDGFGFGARGVFDDATFDFTPADGVEGLLVNLRWVPSWIAGGLVLLVLAVVGLLRTRGDRRWSVAALAVVVPLGYLTFWGPYAMGVNWEGVVLFGPYYLLPVVLPLVVFGAAALVGLVRDGRTSTQRWRRWAAPVVVVVMVAVTATAVPDKITRNLAVQDEFRAIQALVEAEVPDDSVVFLPFRGNSGYLGSTPFLENDPDLDGPVLYAEDRGAEDFAVLDRFGDRAAFRLSHALPGGQVLGGPVRLDRLTVDRGARIELRIELDLPDDATADPDPGRSVVAYVGDGTTDLQTRPVPDPADAGERIELGWTVAAPDAATGPAGDDPVVRLPGDRSSGVLAVGVQLGGTDGTGARWELRLPYRVIDGGRQLEVLQPGQSWSRPAGTGAGWAVDLTSGVVTGIPPAS
ncbi:DUF7846 domain-containing protein [Nakamurella leprariae]|uniref:DUF7846 domain-containing protein n=1 Tax=Nakamurella leprariae TaxID=2803911 RepID=A0A939C3B9_9ACTN|nr:hypothetical protein [Nakamurella leprariae]MBM9469254.1 hypothetical protein [Nakamurella leprariae]